MIFLDFGYTGDGQLTAAQLISILKRRQAKLSSLATLMERYPQVIVNVKADADGKARLNSDEEITAAIQECTDKLGSDGRVLVRASGTEPLIRVMVEGKDFDVINQYAVKIGETIKRRVGCEE